jgi:predicted adenine nucleotide alpha hydrolase (AANH) superfamily ATPase
MVDYYNPNIFPQAEYERRAGEQVRLVGEMNARAKRNTVGAGDVDAKYERRAGEQVRLVGEMNLNEVSVRVADYGPGAFLDLVNQNQELEIAPEGGARCAVCFRLRLEHAARAAKEGGYGCFTTTLTVSPHKNAPLINEIGEEVAREYGVTFLPCDFKKKDGYKRSLELSKEYGLYRQVYCGCEYSMRERSGDKA